MVDLLPNTRDLLVSLLNGLDAETEDLPEVRVGRPSRSGCRYWLYGGTRKPFEGRRQAAEFEELRAAGLLRKLRTDKSTGTYFAFTPAAFRERDATLGGSAPKKEGLAKSRPQKPPPELEEARARLEILGTLAEEARTAIGRLIAVSGIKKTVENDPDSGFVYIPKHWWAWRPLAKEDRPLLGAARDASEQWLETCRTTLAVAGPEHLEEFDELAATMRRMYVRGSKADGPLGESQARNQSEAEAAIDRQFALLQELPSANETGQLVLVPDTNALLRDPDLGRWQVGADECVIAVVSQVQAELDRQKAGEKKVAEKAAGLIRRFKEYGRRGNTLTGVPLAGRRRFRELPIRPDMSLAPQWLDSGDPDDRILAAALEIASSSPNSRVVLVTRDRGLQNKARAAELPAVDVDDL